MPEDAAMGSEPLSLRGETVLARRQQRKPRTSPPLGGQLLGVDCGAGRRKFGANPSDLKNTLSSKLEEKHWKEGKR